MISQWFQAAAEAMEPNPSDGIGRIGKDYGLVVLMKVKGKEGERKE